MNQISPSIYRKLSHLDRELKQKLATFKSSNVSPFQYKIISSPLYVLKNQFFERIPIYYQNKVQFVVKSSGKRSPGLLKQHANLITLISFLSCYFGITAKPRLSENGKKMKTGHSPQLPKKINEPKINLTMNPLIGMGNRNPSNLTNLTRYD